MPLINYLYLFKKTHLIKYYYVTMNLSVKLKIVFIEFKVMCKFVFFRSLSIFYVSVDG